MNQSSFETHKNPQNTHKHNTFLVVKWNDVSQLIQHNKVRNLFSKTKKNRKTKPKNNSNNFKTNETSSSKRTQAQFFPLRKNEKKEIKKPEKLLSWKHEQNFLLGNCAIQR